MYDPAIARFTGVDPIADQFAFVSPYNYAENRPVNAIDLHGLQAFEGAYGNLLYQAWTSGGSKALEETRKGLLLGQGAGVGIGLALITGGLAFEAAPSIYIYAANNPHVVETGAALVWGSVTDEDYPNSSADDAAKVGRHTLGKAMDELTEVAVKGSDEGRLVLNKLVGGGANFNYKLGDYSLWFANQGSEVANKAKNLELLNSVMAKGRPIGDSHLEEAGNLIQDTGYLQMERDHLNSAGWRFLHPSQSWHPPTDQK
jgi:hypothetical protein